MTDFTMTKDADGVALITWDVPNKSMNVLSLDGAATLNPLSWWGSLRPGRAGTSLHPARVSGQ